MLTAHLLAAVDLEAVIGWFEARIVIIISGLILVGSCGLAGWMWKETKNVGKAILCVLGGLALAAVISSVFLLKPIMDSWVNKGIQGGGTPTQQPASGSGGSAG